MTIGKPLDRVEARQKVTGDARYASDRRADDMLYAVPVGSTIAAGRVLEVDATDALALPGVRAVYDRTSFPKLNDNPKSESVGNPFTDEGRAPLSDDVVRYFGQYVALVVGESIEAATEAASRLRVTYEPGVVNNSPMRQGEERHTEVSKRGTPEDVFDTASIRVDQVYCTPAETHNPIELHATVASWEGDRLTVHETTQGINNTRAVLAHVLGIPLDNVRVISRFLGSGFGGKLWPWPHAALAAVAAQRLKCPVKLVLTREQMFTNVGYRPPTEQRVRVSASKDGRLTSLQHDYVNLSGMLDPYEEYCAEATPFFYSTANLRVSSSISRRNVGAPTSMRGPGAVPGLYATESAMNELASELAMDAVALRLLNAPEKDESLNIPFSSNHFKECLRVGAERFGWASRTPAVGSMRRDGTIIGWGVAGASWLAARFAAEARVEIFPNGTTRVSCGTQDIGTGTYTMLAQITSEATGLPVEKIEVVLGDTDLPRGPLSGGSMVTASIVPAVIAAVEDARRKTASLAGVTEVVTGYGTSGATFGAEHPTKSSHSFGAHFVEVAWEPDIVRLQVRRVVTVIDAGKIINPKTARNQIEGAIVMGVGMALFEETHYDPVTAAPLNRSLADYVVASNADHPDMDVMFLDYPDKNLNEYGARGVGEIGLAGVAAAITDAAYHATGVRVRDLPITIEKLLAGPAKSSFAFAKDDDRQGPAAYGSFRDAPFD